LDAKEGGGGPPGLVHKEGWFRREKQSRTAENGRGMAKKRSKAFSKNLDDKTGGMAREAAPKTGCTSRKKGRNKNFIA